MLHFFFRAIIVALCNHRVEFVQLVLVGGSRQNGKKQIIDKIILLHNDIDKFCLPTAVIVGRPYNVCDLSVSQDLPYKLHKIGVLAIPMDFLPLETVDLTDRYENMFWRSGQDILAAGRLVRHNPRLQAIYINSFLCGPDSFLVSYFRHEMRGKPFLEIEIDDHTADAGIVTRCEAFFESLRIQGGRP